MCVILADSCLSQPSTWCWMHRDSPVLTQMPCSRTLTSRHHVHTGWDQVLLHPVECMHSRHKNWGWNHPVHCSSGEASRTVLAVFFSSPFPLPPPSPLFPSSPSSFLLPPPPSPSLSSTPPLFPPLHSFFSSSCLPLPLLFLLQAPSYSNNAIGEHKYIKLKNVKRMFTSSSAEYTWRS